DGFLENPLLHFWIVYRNKRPGVARRDLALFDGELDKVGQLQQPQGVRDGDAVFPHAFGHFLLGEPKLLDKALEAERRLYGIELLALDVFHQSEFEALLVVGLAYI